MHDHRTTALPRYATPGPAFDSLGRTMRAVVQDKYGPPDVLEQATVAMPVPARAEIRVRVAAASVKRT